MPLDPDLEAFLELAELGRMTGRSQAMHELSVEQARAEFEKTSAVLDPSPPTALNVTELKVAARDGYFLDARLYGHADLAPGATTLLYYHGGGYVVGSLNSHDSICRRLAASGRYAVFAPAYRLAPEAPFPTAVNDALDAANWLAEQAANLGLDAKRLVVAGDSAGATLATVLAIAATGATPALSFKPLAQLLFYPVTDISRQRPSHARYAEGYLLETPTLEWFYNHYCAPDQRSDWRISPLTANVGALAPAYISVAEYDPLHDEGIAYAQAMEQAGGEVTLIVQPGLTHDFLRMSGISGQIDGIYQAVEGWLAPY
ncbi:alpha/beta hydrolase [Pseudomonas sp.]|uniref:alpha/beta hydrolase n=1 Tax=Pseudomonas sp. TaxID=306 RepID=UPI002FC61DA3